MISFMDKEKMRVKLSYKFGYKREYYLGYIQKRLPLKLLSQVEFPMENSRQLQYGWFISYLYFTNRICPLEPFFNCISLIFRNFKGAEILYTHTFGYRMHFLTIYLKFLFKHNKHSNISLLLCESILSDWGPGQRL